MGLSRRDRVDKDIDELFEYMDELDSHKWRAEVAFNISQVAYEHAYETDDPTDYRRAREFTEDVTRPLIAGYHADEDVDVDLEGWYDRLQDVPGTNDGVSLAVHSDRITELRERVNEQHDPDAFDYIVGPFSGGIAPMYAVEQDFDADPVLLRYSVDRGDDDVRDDPTYDDVTFEDADVLLVDDIAETGSTFEEVGRYLRQEGADTVETVPAWSLGWGAQDDSETAPLDAVIGHRQDNEFKR